MFFILFFCLIYFINKIYVKNNSYKLIKKTIPLLKIIKYLKKYKKQTQISSKGTLNLRNSVFFK